MDFQALIENRLIVDRCTVFYWQDYYFEETDEYRNKYWITLNCKVNSYPISIILPTSKYEKNYKDKPDKLEDCVLIQQGESTHFDYSGITVLDLKKIHEEEEYTIKEAYEEGFLIELGSMEDHICKRIEKTIRESDLLENYMIKKLLCI